MFICPKNIKHSVVLVWLGCLLMLYFLGQFVSIPLTNDIYLIPTFFWQAAIFLFHYYLKSSLRICLIDWIISRRFLLTPLLA